MNSCEGIYIKNVENGIRGIKMGTKKPEDVAVTVSSNLNKLNPINKGMYDELLVKYEKIVNHYNTFKK